jgi:hypothetical protein
VRNQYVIFGADAASAGSGREATEIASAIQRGSVGLEINIS